jgi:hypothetical protein
LVFHVVRELVEFGVLEGVEERNEGPKEERREGLLV